jgi:hypothetical protein
MVIDMSEKPEESGSNEFVLHAVDAETGIKHQMKFVLQVVEEKGNPMKLGHSLSDMPNLSQTFVFK